MATRIKGKDLSLLFGAEEVNVDATSIVLTNEDLDTATFAEYSSGDASQWFFEITAVSDYADGSLWDYLWENAGSEVSYTFKPYGNANASAAEPHFTGTVRINAKPPLGGTAGEAFTFEARLDCTAAPTRAVA